MTDELRERTGQSDTGPEADRSRQAGAGARSGPGPDGLGSEIPEPDVASPGGPDAGVERVASLWGDVWRTLRRSPLFWLSATLIVVFVTMAIVPGMFTRTDPNAFDLTNSRGGPSAEAWFGYDVQGRDVYARTIHGARASIVVGVLSTLFTVLLGGFVGIISGYYGRLTDSLLSRIGEIFLGLPFFLGAIVILTTFNTPGSSTIKIMFLVITTITVLSWPVVMRIMRSAVIAAKQADYVVAARALGASTPRIILRHLLPNTLAPVLVWGTITIGAFIGAEATLSYLGIGLTPPVISWGVAISDSANYIRIAPHLLLFPGAFLTLTVLAFVLLGEAVREALDPKMR